MDIQEDRIRFSRDLRLDRGDDIWLLALLSPIGGTMATLHQEKRRLAVAMLGGMVAISAGGCAVTEPAGMDSRPVPIPANRSIPLALSGAEEVPPVTTAAQGTGSFEIRPDKSITGDIATTGIVATAAHVHEGAAGKNGPVIVPLARSGDNTWSVAPNARLTESQFLSYLAGNLYVNVHSPAHPGGEIRAQLKPK